jgi:hypothetical protein
MLCRNDDGTITTTLRGWVERTWVTLELNQGVRLYVRGYRFGRKGEPIDDEDRSRDAYYYEEHTCPTNVTMHPHGILPAPSDLATVRATEGVLDPVQPDDPDPHGVFKYIDTSLEKPPHVAANDEVEF